MHVLAFKQGQQIQLSYFQHTSVRPRRRADRKQYHTTGQSCSRSIGDYGYCPAYSTS
jgi:hypothetical protein